MENICITLKSLANICEKPAYQPGEIKKIMEALQLNKNSLALIVGVAPRTVRDWLRGRAMPCNPSSRLLQLLERNAGEAMLLRLSSGESVTDNRE